MMTNLNIEQAIFEIIANGGNARSLAYEALAEAQASNFEKADETFKQAQDELNTAHNTQTKIIQSELNGEPIEKSLLLIHAQDHLMTAISEMNLIEQMMKLVKRIDQLENK